MLYVVTGYHRSGTTAMIRALIHGTDLPYRFSSAVTALIRSREIAPDLYDPNPYGYLQNGKLDLTQQDGKLFKYNLFHFVDIPENLPMTVILMNRDPLEVETSYLQSFGEEMSLSIKVANEAAIANLRSNPNVTVVDVEFYDMIHDPQAVFERLADYIPNLNVEVATNIIDPDLYRVRLV
jgi:hypothetical protein